MRFKPSLLLIIIRTVSLNNLNQTHDWLADSDSVIEPYKVVIIRVIPLYGIITYSYHSRSLSIRRRFVCGIWSVTIIHPKMYKLKLYCIFFHMYIISRFFFPDLEKIQNKFDENILYLIQRYIIY